MSSTTGWITRMAENRLVRLVIDLDEAEQVHDVTVYFADSEQPWSEREFGVGSPTRTRLERVWNVIDDVLRGSGEIGAPQPATAVPTIIEAALGVLGEIDSNPLVVWPEGIAHDRYDALRAAIGQQED